MNLDLFKVMCYISTVLYRALFSDDVLFFPGDLSKSKWIKPRESPSLCFIDVQLKIWLLLKSSVLTRCPKEKGPTWMTKTGSWKPEILGVWNHGIHWDQYQADEQRLNCQDCQASRCDFGCLMASWGIIPVSLRHDETYLHAKLMGFSNSNHQKIPELWNALGMHLDNLLSVPCLVDLITILVNYLGIAVDNTRFVSIIATPIIAVRLVNSANQQPRDLAGYDNTCANLMMMQTWDRTIAVFWSHPWDCQTLRWFAYCSIVMMFYNVYCSWEFHYNECML